MAKKKGEEDQVVEIGETKPVIKVAFDSWYYSKKNIPRHHAKETILADFKARGLSMEEEYEVYEIALKLYGIR